MSEVVEPTGQSDGGEQGGRLQEVLAARREKLERLRLAGVEPFALRFDKTADAAGLHVEFDGLEPGQEADRRASVAGRIVLLRRQGRISFATLRDATGDIQLFMTEESMGPTYRLLDDLDLGDIVGAEGGVMKTRRGELSVRVQGDGLTLLTKALRPLPEKWAGLRDPEARLRRRYLELATSPESRRVVSARAALLKTLRRVLDDRGFVEVETPALHSTPGGAVARPFATHHGTLDMPLYLRIAPELYLKRLLVGGLDRVYEIGRNFRNEGIDRQHNTEFTSLEVYQAYADYLDMLELVEALVRESAVAVRGDLEFEYGGRRVDLSSPWRRARLDELVGEAAGRRVSLDAPDDLRAIADKLAVSVDPAWPPGKVMFELYEKLVEGALFEPTWVMDVPRDVSPLARPHRTTPGFTEHADLVIAGSELAPVYSELSDPDEQRARFELQRAARSAGAEEAHPYDEEFIEALEHGMPPAGGFGLGIDRLVALLVDAPSLREVILFPQLRPEPRDA
jgi:lysyl-tRNA synthetase class 2